MLLLPGSRGPEDELLDFKYSSLVYVAVDKTDSCCPFTGYAEILTLFVKTDNKRPIAHKTDKINNFFIRRQIL
jgi:hypothetical protein